jgi:hypothetical protein
MFPDLCANDTLEAIISNLLVMATDIRNEITTTLGIDFRSSDTGGVSERRRSWPVG